MFESIKNIFKKTPPPEDKAVSKSTMELLDYIHLKPPHSPPKTDFNHPFVAVVIIDIELSDEWRHEVSEWLVETGCLYMMAWGKDCSLWDDAVDVVNLEAYDWKDIPDDKSIMTTWHDDESLEDVLWFATHSATHNSVPLNHLIILDITENPRENSIRDLLFTAINDV